MKIDLPPEAWNIVVGALGKMPYEQVAGVITEIVQQAQASPLVDVSAVEAPAPAIPEAWTRQNPEG